MVQDGSPDLTSRPLVLAQGRGLVSDDIIHSALQGPCISQTPPVQREPSISPRGLRGYQQPHAPPTGPIPVCHSTHPCCRFPISAHLVRCHPEGQLRPKESLRPRLLGVLQPDAADGGVARVPQRGYHGGRAGGS